MLTLLFAFMHAYMSMFDHIEWCAYLVLVFCLDFEEDQRNLCDCCVCAGCCDQGKWYFMSHLCFLIALVFSSSMHHRWFCLFSKYTLCLEHLVVCSHPETPARYWFSCTWLLSQMLLFHFGCGIYETLKINNLNETPGWIEPCLVAEWNVDRHPGTKRFVGLHCFS